jgi:hypothetical protein
VTRERRPGNDERPAIPDFGQRRVRRDHLGEAVHVVQVVVTPDALTCGRTDSLNIKKEKSFHF